MSYTINKVLECLREANLDATVTFSFGNCKPTKVDSWRGIYSEPALGFSSDIYDPNVTAESLISELEKSISGETYHGYKGGEFKFSGNDQLHIDSYGEYSETEIDKIEVHDGYVVIHTHHED